jgi:hypothetical protein
MLLLAAVLSLTAFYKVCTGFSFWDDMGYLLMTQRMFSAGYALYDQIYTHYGPAYYAWEHFLGSATRLPLSHDSTLLFTTFSWVAISFLCAGFVSRVTHSLFLMALTCFDIFYLLMILKNEPGHPQELCGLLLGGMLLVSSLLDSGRRAGIKLGLIGFFIGVLGMTKPNLGVYAALAGWITLCNLVAAPRVRNILFGAGALAALALPIVLMRHNLGEAGSYCLLECGAILLLIIQLAKSQPERWLAWRSFLWPVPGCIVGLAACAGYALLNGTSLAGLVRGMVLQNIGLDRIMFRWPAFGPEEVLFSLGLAFVVWVTTGSGWYASQIPPWLPTVVKLSLAPLLILPAVLMGLDVHPARMVGPGFAWVLPLTVATAFPLPRQPRPAGGMAPRQFALALAVLSALWGYPVWGSQAELSFFLLIPVAMVSCADGLRYGYWQFGKTVVPPSSRRQTAGMALSFLSTLGIVGVALVSAGSAAKSYHCLEPSGLRGSGSLRLPREQAETYHRIIGAARAHGRSFFTMPALGSLHVWADNDPPTCMFVPSWMTLLTPSQQSKAVADLQKTRDLCVIRWNPGVLFWTHGRDVSGNKLVRYVEDGFITVESFEGCDIMVRRLAAETTGGKP